MKAAEMYMEAFKKDVEEIIEERGRDLIESDRNHTTLEELIDEIYELELTPLKKMAQLIEDMDYTYGDDLNDLYWTASWSIGKHLMDRMPEILQRTTEQFIRNAEDCKWDEDEAETKADQLNDVMVDQVDRIIEMIGSDPENDEDYLENPMFRPFWDWFDNRPLYEAIKRRFAA